MAPETLPTIEFEAQTLEGRFLPQTFNPSDNTVEVVFATPGAKAPRFDFMRGDFDEVLSFEAGAVRTGRLTSGRMAVLDTHQRFELRNQVGVTLEGSVSSAEGGKAKLKLSSREELAWLRRDVAEPNVELRPSAAGKKIRRQDCFCQRPCCG